MDRARVLITENVSVDISTGEWSFKEVDEIKIFFDCRYLLAYEAIWILFQFDIYFWKPIVERLAVHLPFMNRITYHGDQNLKSVLAKRDVGKTMFYGMDANKWDFWKKSRFNLCRISDEVDLEC